MNEISALKVGCGKFFYGKGVLEQLAPEIFRLGGRAFVIGGVHTLPLFLKHVNTMLEDSNIFYYTETFHGECTAEKAQKYADLANTGGYSVFVAIGGGKCIDQVKCASVFSGLPIITVPTSIATCVATSMVAIMYNDLGQRAPAVNLKKEVDVCIADRDLIASAPERTLSAGILDSLAKYPESVHQKKGYTYKDCNLKEYIQMINAKGIYDFLINEYSNIYQKNKECELFDDFILTNLLHTSIVSGFADGSGQLAIAHATYDFMRNHNTKNAASFLHGEIVGVGLILQMYFNEMPKEEINRIRNSMKEMQMPCNFRDLNYAESKENISLFLDIVCSECSITSAGEKSKLEKVLNEIL
jgi:Glycerol dehydrogenase and related enzymes